MNLYLWILWILEFYLLWIITLLWAFISYHYAILTSSVWWPGSISIQLLKLLCISEKVSVKHPLHGNWQSFSSPAQWTIHTNSHRLVFPEESFNRDIWNHPIFNLFLKSKIPPFLNFLRSLVYFMFPVMDSLI